MCALPDTPCRPRTRPMIRLFGRKKPAPDATATPPGEDAAGRKAGFSVDELAAAFPDAAPADTGSAGAFYWQAEALVDAIRRRLGPADFAVYLGLLSVPGAPFWQLPLRERWYFNDADFERLSRQIRPTP